MALSRLVYRKGIDIMALVIPEVCHRHPRVKFIIGEWSFGFLFPTCSPEACSHPADLTMRPMLLLVLPPLLRLLMLDSPPLLLLLLCAGGDGPKRALLQQMISSEGLEGRVQLTGAIPHERARDFLVSFGALHVLPQIRYTTCTSDVLYALQGCRLLYMWVSDVNRMPLETQAGVGSTVVSCTSDCCRPRVT